MTQNQGVATFFDVAASQYYSLLYVYSRAAAFSHWYMVAKYSNFTG
jgi:hypothetical protein